MIPQLLHPSSAKLLGELASLFRSKKIFTSRDRRLVFLCGGPVKPRKSSFRKKLLAFAHGSLPEFRFFLAEDAARDIFAHGEPMFVNLAEFESLVSQLADCVLIIPESSGSIAELGYFSARTQIREKLLIVNDEKYQGDESFITLGPIELTDRHTRYRPTLQLKLKAKAPNFRPIVRYLERYQLEIRGHFEFNRYSKLSVRNRLFAIFELIYLFREISHKAAEVAIQHIFQDGKSLTVAEKRDLRQLLSILCAGRYVERVAGTSILKPVPDVRPFLEIDESTRNSLRIRIADFLQRTTRSESTKQTRDQK